MYFIATNALAVTRNALYQLAGGHMPTRYLVLRATVPSDRGFGLSPRSRGTNRTDVALTDLAIQTFDGNETDEGDLRADPQNHAVMDADVALKLIPPTARATA